LKRILKNFLADEKGVTLIEVIASFVLLVIAIFSFYNLFIQTAKTTKSSESIVDATYIAQSEIENIYNESKVNGLDIASLNKLGYITDINSTALFSKTITLKQNNTFNVTLTIKNQNTPLKNVIIRVISNKDNKQKALMEKTIIWKEN